MMMMIYCVPLPPDKRRSKHFTVTVTQEEKQDGIYSKFQVKIIYIYTTGESSSWIRSKS